MIVNLQKGDILFREGQLGQLWQLKQGIVLLQKSSENSEAVMHLAMPGDHLGLEAFSQRAYSYTAVALFDCKLEARSVHEVSDRYAAVIEGYLQQQRSLTDMAHLRTGSVASRLEHLLNLVQQGLGKSPQHLARRDLPTLRDMSQILDIAIETISRDLKPFFAANADRVKLSSGKLTEQTSRSWAIAA